MTHKAPKSSRKFGLTVAEAGLAPDNLRTAVLKMNIVLKEEERQKCEIWTRVMGYFRPVSEFNKGKKAEFYSRQYFTEQKAILPSIRAESETDIKVINKKV